jgi:hypothetical protein
MGCGLTIENTDCRLRVLRSEFDADQATKEEIQSAIESVYASGAVYSLTDTAAALNFGGTDPAIVLLSAGTYLILSTAQLEYAAATITTQTATLKLRRTNNTAADITGIFLTIDLPAATTQTYTVGAYSLPVAVYTTTNDDDALTLFGNLDAAAGAGSVQCSDASIVAVRLF